MWLTELADCLPAGQAMTAALASALDTEIVYRYTLPGTMLWWAIMAVVAILASGLSARKATRISVWQSLAYL